MEQSLPVTIVIPTLNPDEKLLSLLQDLRAAQFHHILVVNDGSGPQYDCFFEKAREDYGCIVLTHAVNQGKGRALKTAFHYLLNTGETDAAVSVDADGQHRVPDIRAVALETLTHPESLVLGCRDFSRETAGVPARSRFGNVLTSRLLRILCGITLSDTQTGLRGFSPETMRRFLSTKGERYEYEMNMLLDAKEQEIPLREVPIETVYLEENRSSHFNPLVDSFRIYAVFSRFILSSLASFAVDLSLFTLFHALLASWSAGWAIVVSAYLSRAVSALINYSINKKRVFKNHSHHRQTLLRYAVLWVCQATLSAFATQWLVGLSSLNETLVKAIVDLVLFFLSFRIQRGWVFQK